MPSLYHDAEEQTRSHCGAAGGGWSPVPAAAPVSGQDATPAVGDVIPATTTSTADTGLLDAMAPSLVEATGYTLKPIAVGSGAALELGERGVADGLLVHSPASEEAFMADGYGTERRTVMDNDFVYTESGTGMGDTLNIAGERGGYTLTDRGTYLALQDRNGPEILVEDDPLLLNVCHDILVNPQNGRDIDDAAGRAFLEFLLLPKTQEFIGQFGVAEFGEPLFTPCGDNSFGVVAAKAPISTRIE